MFNKYYAVAWLGLAAAFANAANAQDSLVQQKELGPDGQPILIEFSAAGRASARAAESEQVMRQQLGLGTHDQLKLTHTETDQLGFTHQKFAQFYKGVKVEHATYTAHSRGGQLESLSGDFEQVGELSVTPALSAAAALGQALAAVGAKKYMWQDAREEAGLKESTNDPTASFTPRGELVLVRDSRHDAENGPLVLAWKFDIYAQQPLSRAYLYVDAQRGEVVLQDAIIKHITRNPHHVTATAATAATATFATAYSGPRSLADETAPNGGYRLREYTRGLGIETYNCKKGTYLDATDFVDADNNWTAAEYDNANHDNAAGDAHFGAQSTYDYWKEVFGRNSYDNAGTKILSYVHFSVRYENAFWDGLRMTYGDGASLFKPLTALDVCAHEIGHAVCENTANLTYLDESGALNEGLSDIWGASVEKYTADKYGLTGKSTYLLGEEIMQKGGALRSMDNPSTSYNPQPAYYKGANWYAGGGDYGGVHTNSGVLNYWYYLISNGKTGTNEKGEAFAVTGIGLTDAAKITFRMESVYMTASSNYATARTYSIQAATDLFGATATQAQSVTNAWAAVGIGAPYGTPPPTSTYCTSKGANQNYEYIDYVQLGTGLARTSGADGGYYDGTATSTSLAAGSSPTISFSAGFTGPAFSEKWKVYIDYDQNGMFTDAGELVVSRSSSRKAILSSTFTVPPTAKSGPTRLRIIMSDANSTTSCGTYDYGETEDYRVNITGGATSTDVAAGATLTETRAPSDDVVLRVYPNPATSVLTLSLGSNEALTHVEVLDAYGRPAAAARYLGNGQLDVAGLAGGLYLLRASNGQQTFAQRFVKQ